MKQFFQKVADFATTATLVVGFITAIAAAIEAFNSKMQEAYKKGDEKK